MTDADVDAIVSIVMVPVVVALIIMIVRTMRRSRERLAKEESVAARVRHPMQPNGWGDDEVSE